ncbi:MAG: serine/threonine-protein phosphatase [Oscillospiraceae bacterium]|nr:serine/threonine-protein phosphatase [Oscillospiraceae bacterium]
MDEEMLSKTIFPEDMEMEAAVLPEEKSGAIGKVHNIGKRQQQQDMLGVYVGNAGILAVVSDGMGGLSDGEKVSQTAVRTMMQAAVRLKTHILENPLFEMLAETNSRVLHMLGSDQIYKSGATLLAALVTKTSFHWISVGDSRIYLYCGRHLIQINREHIFQQELILQAINEKIDFSSININKQKNGLVSFLGMGDLKYVDGSLRPVKILHGDKLLLMSDGIFNTLSEMSIIDVLENTANASEASILLERLVIDVDNPVQDNFTCVIFDF